MSYKTKITPQYPPAGTATTEITIATMVGNPGPQGPKGDTGPTGPQGDTGPTGDKGWSPTFAVVSDGDRRVLQVDDWVGGEGSKPATGDYVGATGLVSAIADAVDIRGPEGTAGDPTDLSQAGAAHLDGIVWSDVAGAWEVGPSVAARILAKEVRQGKEPVLLHDFANDAHHVINPDDATGLELDLSRIWTFARNSTVNGWTAGPVLTEFASGAPAFVIDPATGQALGYRALQGFTNSLLWSRDLSNAVWSDVGSISKSQNETGIDEESNRAWTLTDNDGADASKTQQDITISNDSATHVFVSFIKKTQSASTFPQISMFFRGGTGINYSVVVNTDTGEVLARDAATVGNVDSEDAGNYWQVILNGANNSSGNTTLRNIIHPAVTETFTDNFDNSVTGSIVYDFGGVYLNSSIAVPPIETEGSPVSTAADDATEPMSQWFNKNEGTFIVEVYKEDIEERGIILSTLPDGTPNSLLIEITDGDFRASDWDGPSEIVSLAGATSVKGAMTYSGAASGGGTLKTAANGILSAGSNSFDLSGDQTDLVIGNLAGNTDFYFNGAIARIEYYPRKFTDAELQEVTS